VVALPVRSRDCSLDMVENRIDLGIVDNCHCGLRTWLDFPCFDLSNLDLLFY